MLMHPGTLLELAHQHRRDLIDEADRARLLARARARRLRAVAAPRGEPIGTLAPCDPSAVVPAQ